MRTISSLVTIALAVGTLGACGLSVSGIADTSSDGGSKGDATASSEGGGTSSGETGSSGSASSSSGATSSSGSASSGGSTSSSGGTSSSGASSSGSGSDGGLDGTVADGSGDDSTSPDAPVADVGPDTAPPPDTGGGCTSATGCYMIPGGWSFVAVVGDHTTSCPSGYDDASDLFESPDASNGCTCGTCAIQGPTTCENGAIDVHYDVKNAPGAGQCGSPGQPSSNSNTPPGSCGTDLYAGGGLLPYSSIDLEFHPPPVTGQCTSAGTEETANVTFGAEDRACQTNGAGSGCTGNQCTPTFTSPFQACIIKSGSQTCPAASAFTQQHLAGTGATYTCSDCGCNVTATCSGTMNLYTDNSCKDNQTQLPVDDQCHGASGNAFGSYKYVADAPQNLACASTGSSSAQNVQLIGQQTICCVP